MTSKLQNPSASWKNGTEYLRSLSHVPTVAASAKPLGPNIHSRTLASCARLPSNVLSTQPPLFVASTANRFKLQINSPGTTTHCVKPTKMTRVRLPLDL